ncbi:J domain-containing protein [Methylococcus mesophilus]|uniref:J domain-containing protein n=1 Tax=Methylococcus mesophilus TaxID=2993564 RepID=UPI00224AD530|nr:J domain-containing protein [Methylococcus mesophilus]UZR30274.1 DnaJ domain-containing protein [Methylococcus mesophilus]
MSRNKYHGRFALERYRGYWLWAVQRREVLQRPYPKVMACGRTDTEDEAYGQIAAVLAGLEFGAITGGWAPSWAKVRDHLRAEGEKRRCEGSRAWAAFKAERGPRGLAALTETGRRFLAGWEAELRHQAADVDWLEFLRFCLDTERNPADKSEEILRAFRRWRIDQISAQAEAEAAFRRGQAGERAGFGLGLAVHQRQVDLQVLGLPAGAEPAAIKTAWRRLAMRLHPDRGGDHQSFTRAKAAYERLMG